jgi:hypothetical protein
MKARPFPALILAEAQNDALLVRIDAIEEAVERDTCKQQKPKQKKKGPRNAAADAAGAIATAAAATTHHPAHAILAATQNLIEIGRFLATAPGA